MSQADELLANLTENPSRHFHPVVDDDGYFVINPDTKQITSKTNSINYLMQFDHKSERYTIEIPRIIEGHDMTLCNRVLVHFVNIDNDTQAERYDFAEINDLRVDPENEDLVICTWLIERHATQFAGSLAFLVQYSCITDEGETDYEFHSDWYSDIFVKKGRRDINPTIFEYNNLLDQWYKKLFGTEKDVPVSWNDLSDKPFYDEYTYEELLPEQSVELTSPNNIPPASASVNFPSTSSGLKNNTTYKIVFDGVEYICLSDVKYASIGNEHIKYESDPDTGEPFEITKRGSIGCTIYATDSGTHTIAIYELVSTIHHINEKYIPDTIARVSNIVIPDLTEAPTATDFNNLLDALRSAGYLSEQTQ